MTKLAIMSDLHIDLNQFGDFEISHLIGTLQSQNVDWLHIAGDVSNHFNAISQPFLDNLSQYLKVTYNLGNHDMLDLDEDTITELDFQTYDLGEKTLLAFHGWYDYSFTPETPDQEHLRLKQQFWFDRRLKRPLPDRELTEAICQQLDKILVEQTKPVIIAMHFVPHQRFTMTHETFKPFNAFLGSQAFHEVFRKHKVTDVVFGHAHRSYGTQTINGIHYHSRPLGYVREWDLTIAFVNEHPELNPTGTWNLSKRYNLVKKRDDFKAYYRQELTEELLKSMTIFEV